jgi:hypothetical protein
MFDLAATRRALERMESYCAAPNWNMKTKLIIIIGLLATANSSHATLIDLTPGGFHKGAGANIDGNSVHWSQFEPFGSNEFSIIPLGPNALISWDLSLTDGYMFQYLLLEGVNHQANIYRVPGAQFIDGTAYVTVDNFSMIQAIIFYGTNVVAETVNTGWLLFFAVVGLLLRYKLRQRRIA